MAATGGVFATFLTGALATGFTVVLAGVLAGALAANLTGLDDGAAF